ncbi:bifunctional lysylphosphatidylglycerol flippase/synthetase MprF [Nocardia jejuensis]|uniref:bifunctional lysylphosphatidylglycerol flippase/synthetase MprF n=1 Tax=Nocardia jejuensis TaxID=328049 RepID=UPI00082AEACA|nr:DUF2156 domain-containing protein [Nocardia jejuensis]
MPASVTTQLDPRSLGAERNPGLPTLVRPLRNICPDSRVRALLSGHGTSSMSWMTTWPGNRYWFDHDATGFVAFRVVGRVAISTGEPVGPDPARTLAGFVAHCDEMRWTPCLYAVGADSRALLAAAGWTCLQIAEDAVIPLESLTFTGKAHQDARTALNRARAAGVTARWIDYRTASAGITAQIELVCARWLADKGLPELGFTLGNVASLADPRVRCLIAIDAADRVHAVTSWLPVHRDGAVVGWTLDLQRRLPDGFGPVMDFLIASALLTLQAEGAEFVSLSGVPLARHCDVEARHPWFERGLDFAARALEPLYGFASLAAYKRKFRPSYAPLYACFPRRRHAARVSAAVTRAYLPSPRGQLAIAAAQALAGRTS